jgi:hypothetical protein
MISYKLSGESYTTLASQRSKWLSHYRILELSLGKIIADVGVDTGNHPNAIAKPN